MADDGQEGLILGWDKGEQAAFGFEQPHPAAPAGQPIRYGGDAHLLAVAPTGAGKGRDLVIPLMLDYPGSIIAIDPKGENAAVTARRRIEMGQEVILIDPFAVLTGNSHGLNPFDLFDLPGSTVECDAEMLASQLSIGLDSDRDPYWAASARGFLSGLIAQVAGEDKPKRHLGEVRGYLHDMELDYRLCSMIDKKTCRSDFVREEIAAYLAIPSDKTRPCVHSTAISFMKVLGSPPVARSLTATSFALTDLLEGKPLTIYLILPPDKLQSHRALLRLWVGTLMTVIMRRNEIPDQKTLFIIDEAAQLDHFPLLLTASTLLRGYGLQMLTIWQDIAQLKSRYPKDWQTILNNAGVLTAFGFANYSMARDWGEVLGLEAAELLTLAKDQASLHLRGESSRTIRRLNYLRDPHFAGLFDPNPFFARKSLSPGR